MHGRLAERGDDDLAAPTRHGAGDQPRRPVGPHATKAGAGWRASGWCAPRLSTWWISVSTKPGLTSVTATPAGASSKARACASPRTANLLIAYAEAPASATWPVTLPMMTRRP